MHSETSNENEVFFSSYSYPIHLTLPFSLLPSSLSSEDVSGCSPICSMNLGCCCKYRCHLGVQASTAHSVGCVSLDFGKQRYVDNGNSLTEELEGQIQGSWNNLQAEGVPSAYIEQKCPRLFPKLELSTNNVIIFIASILVCLIQIINLFLAKIW